MEKQERSNLTEEQHEIILERIQEIKKEENDAEAQIYAEWLTRFMHTLEACGFINREERERYKKAIKEAMNEREEARYGNLSEQ